MSVEQPKETKIVDPTADFKEFVDVKKVNFANSCSPGGCGGGPGGACQGSCRGCREYGLSVLEPNREGKLGARLVQTEALTTEQEKKAA